MDLKESELFAICWTKAQPTVASFVSSLIPNFHQGEDVLHQVALTLVRKFSDYDPSQPFVNWAIGVARLEVLKFYSRASNDRLRFDDDIVALVGADFQALNTELDDRRQALRDCLRETRGRSLEALRLRYFEGLKPPTIAKRLRMADGAVRVLLHRVRTTLKECIERRLAALEDRS